MAVEQEEKFILEDIVSLENYLKNLFDFFPLPTSLLTPLSVILEFNPAFEEISGYKFDEIVGKPLHTIFTKKDTKELIKETKDKGRVKGKEMILRRKDKKKVPVSVFTRIRRGSEGRIAGFFLSAFDLTEIKKAQEELEEARLVLEIKIRARTRELREFNKTLEEKVKERTKELEKRIKELEKFNRLTGGRELRLRELKTENERLKKELLKIEKEVNIFNK